MRTRTHILPLAALVVLLALTHIHAADAGAVDNVAAAQRNIFRIQEGSWDNWLFQSGRCSAHVAIERGRESRVYAFFPAGNAGIAFTAQNGDNPGAPLELAFEGEPAEYVKDRQLGVVFAVEAKAQRVRLRDVLMDSIRVIRKQDAKGFMEGLAAAKREHLALAGLPEEGFLAPRISAEGRGAEKTLILTTSTLDERNSYRCAISFRGTVEIRDDVMTLASADGAPLTLRIAASVDYEPLSPYGGADLLNPSARAFAQSLTGAPKRRFDESTRALGFLSYREKFLAGSWRYLTYFGRDTMMTAMLLRDSVQPEVFESAMQSILDRLSDKGEVAHEEDIGGQAIARRLPALIALERAGKTAQAKEELAHLQDPLYDYKMVDDDFMLPLMLEGTHGSPRLAAFLARRNVRGETNGESLARNLDYVLGESRAFAGSGNAKDLVRIREGLSVGDWRDSAAGLGWGAYPASINMGLVHGCLVSIRSLLKSGALPASAVSPSLSHLREALENPGLLDRRIRAWARARNSFLVKLPLPALRARLADYLARHVTDEREREYLLARRLDDGVTVRELVEGGKAPRSLREGLEFHALSLGKDGAPIEVMSSDIGFLLFFDSPSPAELERLVTILRLPFPVGLCETGGLLTASPVFASDASLRKTLDRRAYHGMVVWAWQVALIEKGLMRQIRRFAGEPRRKRLVGELRTILTDIQKMKERSGDLVNSELWTHVFEGGEMRPVAFGGAASETESNPVQLWSTVGISVMREYAEIEALLRPFSSFFQAGVVRSP